MTKKKNDGRVSRRSCFLRRLFLGITAAAFGLPGSLYAVKLESARDSAAAAFNSPSVLSSAAEFAAPVAAPEPALSPSVKGARDYAAGGGLYAAVINGRNRQVAVKLGRSWGWTPGEGWNLAASGERYAVWLK